MTLVLRAVPALWLLLCVAAVPKAQASGDTDSYPLDGVDRQLAPGQELPCDDYELVTYRGDRVRHDRTARVNPAFRERLQRFEALVVETAIATYGRAPRTLLSLGTHNCRRIRLYPDLLSEHALGNAIDVAGFSFPRLARGEKLKEGLPPALRAGFVVRLDKHWKATRGANALHSAFLRELARRVIAEPDLFRVVLGPAWPGHHNHFHLDMAPYRMVEVF